MPITKEIKVRDYIYHYILSVPEYVNNQENNIDLKLITILKKAIDIISNISNDTIIHEEEKFIFDSVKIIADYITSKTPNTYNCNYLYELLLTFFEFYEKNIQYDLNIISKDTFNKIFDEYYHVLLIQEKTFIYSILDEKDKDSFEDFIFNYLTEESAIEMEENNEKLLKFDEFLDKLMND